VRPLRLAHRAVLASALWLAACADRDLPEPYRSLPVPHERLVREDVQRQGRAIYLERCAVCHGRFADGDRAQRTSPPPGESDLTDSGWQQDMSDRRLYHVIAEGRAGTAMPSWRATLEPGEIWSVVAYLREMGPRPPVVPKRRPLPAREHDTGT